MNSIYEVRILIVDDNKDLLRLLSASSCLVQVTGIFRPQRTVLRQKNCLQLRFLN